MGHGFGITNEGIGQLAAALAQAFGIVQVVEGALEQSPLPHLITALKLADPLMHQQLFQPAVQWLRDDALPVSMVAAQHEHAEGAAVFAF